ncbi:PPC domain-containing protein [Longimicrobium sp.]|uniref:PPC domain-containing protein n=1 Tax=Longimicrobium sp. TaxID=2029185 RepID=UPI003B3B6C12
MTNPPETAAREVALGQAVTESLESGGDVDDFLLTVPTAGRGMMLFTGTGTGQGTLHVTVLDSAGGERVMQAVSHGADGVGKRFVLPAGRLIVRISSTGTTGPYQFTLHSIATGPESGEGPLALRAWTAGAVAPYYDVDEYAFDGTEGQEVKVYGSGGLEVTLRSPVAGAPELALVRTWQGSGESEPVRLPVTGRYTLTVNTPDPVDARGAGAYQVMVYPIVRTPEGVPAALQHGQTVSEQLDMPADVDEYTFTAARGDIIQWFFQMPAPGTGTFNLIDPVTGQLLSHGPEPFDVPRDGTYTVRVFGGTGAYTLRMFRIDPRPEQVPATIALGQTVQGESIQPSSDLDYYQFTGTAGTEIAMHLRGPLGHWLYLLPAQGDEPLLRLLALQSDDVEGNTSERFVLPYDGTYRVRMGLHGTPHTGISPEPVGAYRFRLSRIQHAPESVPAALTIGQTVTGESLEHRADIDVFTFQAQAGQRLTLWGAKSVMGPSGALAMTIQRPGPEVQPPLAYIWASEQAFMNTFVVPETGTYEVRVFSSSSTGTAPMHMSSYRGPYQLVVRPPDF